MKYTALIFAAALSGLAQAQGVADPSYLGVELGSDEDGGSNTYVDLDLTLPANARLRLSTAESRTAGKSSDITTRSYLVGVASDPLALFSAGVEFEHWGDEGDLVSDTWRLDLGLNGERWAFHVRPQRRTHTLYTDPAVPCAVCPARIEVESRGVAVDAAYFSEGPWSANAGYAKHDYDDKLSGITTHPRLANLLFTPTTLNLANGFQDYQVSLGVSYAESWGVAAYDWVKSVSKLDGAVTYVNTASFSRSLAEQWRLRLSAGWQVAEDSNDSLAFGGLGLTYSW